VFNFLNLLNRDWGEQQRAFDGGSSFLLTEVGEGQRDHRRAALQHARDASAVGVYTFDPNLTAFNANNIASNYQMQFSLRYSF
jgi:hypothetical protein